MKLVLPLLFGASHAATTLTNVACNGKDKITFTLTKDAGTALGSMQTLGCASADGNLDASVYTQNGDTYNFDFNPYTTCMGAADPNQASTYSVDFKILFSNAVTVNGQTMYFSGDQVDLKCTFQDTYSLTSDLGGVNLEGDQLVGDEFALTFEMVRTQSDYSTVESGTVVANVDIFHRITSTSAANLGATDFAFKPSRIRLNKKDATGAVTAHFDLFDSSMTSCGHSELDFELDYDQANSQWTFKYKAFLLDTEQGANYEIVASMELCNSLATDAKCTGADQCTNVLFSGNLVQGNYVTIPVAFAEFEIEFDLSFGDNPQSGQRGIFMVGTASNEGYPRMRFESGNSWNRIYISHWTNDAICRTTSPWVANTGATDTYYNTGWGNNEQHHIKFKFHRGSNTGGHGFMEFYIDGVKVIDKNTYLCDQGAQGKERRLYLSYPYLPAANARVDNFKYTPINMHNTSPQTQVVP